MYLTDDKLDRDTLKQCDIIDNIHCITNINLDNVFYSCEINVENKNKIDCIIVALLRDVGSVGKPDAVESLKASNELTDEAKMNYLKFYYLEPWKKQNRYMSRVKI